MKDPIYDLVMILHIMSAIVGFGTLVVSGVYAANLKKSKDILNSKELKKYFTGKTNYMGYVLFFVPIFGVILLYMGQWHQLSQPYPWVGICCWSIGALAANFIIFPQEKIIGSYVNRDRTLERSQSETPVESIAEHLQQISLRIERASAVATVCFILATVFMVIQPSL